MKKNPSRGIKNDLLRNLLSGFHRNYLTDAEITQEALDKLAISISASFIVLEKYPFERTQVLLVSHWLDGNLYQIDLEFFGRFWSHLEKAIKFELHSKPGAKGSRLF